RQVSGWTVSAVDRQRKVGEGLHAVEELGVALAVELSRLVGEIGRRRTLPPARPVDEEPLRARDLGDVPIADHRLEARRRPSDLVGVEFDRDRYAWALRRLDRRRGPSAQEREGDDPALSVHTTSFFMGDSRATDEPAGRGECQRDADVGERRKGGAAGAL